MGSIKLSQAALITLGMSFMAERVYTSYTAHGRIRASDVLLPALLSTSVIIILLLFFNTLTNGTL
jgi:hypothetical protein